MKSVNDRLFDLRYILDTTNKTSNNVANDAILIELYEKTSVKLDELKLDANVPLEVSEISLSKHGYIQNRVKCYAEVIPLEIKSSLVLAEYNQFCYDPTVFGGNHMNNAKSESQ